MNLNLNIIFILYNFLDTKYQLLKNRNRIKLVKKITKK